MGKQVAAVLEFFFENAGSVTSDLLDVLANASIELSRVIERKRSRDRLRESRFRIIEAQHIARLGSWEWDLIGQKVSWSQELFRIFDLAEDAFEGTYQTFLDKIHPDDLERAQIEFQRAYEYGIPFNFQHRIVRSSGEPRVVQTRGRVILNKQGQPVRIIGTLHDITEMVAIENRLQAQEELLENVVAQSQIILWSIDRQGELRLSRRGGLAALGVPSGDQLGMNVFEILPQDHPLTEYLNQSLAGTAVYVDFKVDERIYDLRILPQMDQQGSVTGVNGIAFDITQRIETEQALRKSEQSYRLVVENVREYAIFSLDRHGYITSWNVGAKRVVGYQTSEIIGKHYSIFFTPEDRDLGLPEEALQIALSQGRYEAEGWRVRKDGTKFWANTLLNPFQDENGELLGYTKLVRDFTRRREPNRPCRKVRQGSAPSSSSEPWGLRF
jgi:PAS domain S-box-containing protein